MKNILEFAPVKQFIETAGKGIQAYFAKDPAVIVYLRPDGAFYAAGLFAWLTKKRKNIVLLSMDDDANDLEEEKVKGRKVLLVDNDIVTGKGYKRAMEAMRVRKSRLGIKDIKFATYFDRVGLADFYVEKYSPEVIWNMEEIDALDLKIIKNLAQDGRMHLVALAKKLNISPVSVRNRLDRLLKERILKVQGVFNIDQFYTFAVHIHIEADSKTIAKLGEELPKLQDVYLLVRLFGGSRVVVCMLGRNLENIDEFVEKEIRSLPGVQAVHIEIGELPVIPKTIPPKF